MGATDFPGLLDKVYPSSLLNSSGLHETPGAEIQATVEAKRLPCKRREGVVGEVTAKTVEMALTLGILPALDILGVAGNIINMAVFHRQGLGDRIHLCLFSLALADCAFLLLMLSAMSYSFLGLLDANLGEYWSQKYRTTLLGLMLGTLNLSNAITTIISVERCICVLSPFLAKNFLKTKRMAVLLVAVTFYILGLYSLLSMKHVTASVTDPVTNESHWTLQFSSFYTSNSVIIDVLYNDFLSLAIPCISLLVVAVTTSLTVVSVRSTIRWRRKSANVNATSKSKKDVASSVTRTLLVVCVVYLTCISLSLVQVFLRTLVPGYLPIGSYCNAFIVGQMFGHLCEVTNASVTFLVYFFIGTKFRGEVRQIFRFRSTSCGNSNQQCGSTFKSTLRKL